MHIEVDRVIMAPRQALWERYTDYASWTDWAGLGRVRLHRPGADSPNGVGAVRVVPGGIHEEVVGFVPPERMDYRIVKGMPVKSHHGTVLFEEEGGGTRIRWIVDIEPSIPGTRWMTERIIRAVFARVLRRLEVAVA